jgi:hypothetical protein
MTIDNSRRTGSCRLWSVGGRRRCGCCWSLARRHCGVVKRLKCARQPVASLLGQRADTISEDSDANIVKHHCQ